MVDIGMFLMMMKYMVVSIKVVMIVLVFLWEEMVYVIGLNSYIRKINSFVIRIVLYINDFV